MAKDKFYKMICPQTGTYARSEKIKATADTAAEKKYAEMIEDTKSKENRATFKKRQRAQEGHSRGTRAHTAAEKQTMKKLKASLAKAKKDLSLLEDYKSEAPQARTFMTKPRKKKAGGGYVKKYANGGGIRKPRYSA